MQRFQMSSLLKPLQHNALVKAPLPENGSFKKQKGFRKKVAEPKIKQNPTPVPVPSASTNKKKKKPIPVALREQVWIHKMGRVFEAKCPVTWCQNTITVFDFQSGHNIPESKGGKTDLENLIPLCGRCNLSMGSQYTIDEWSKMSKIPEKPVIDIPRKKRWWCW